MAQGRSHCLKALHLHNGMLDRVAADNRYVAELDDEGLKREILPKDNGGHYMLEPLREGEKVPAHETVALKKSEDGVLYDPKTRHIFEPTNFIDPKTGKFVKTVRRHPRGPPTGPTYLARKAEEAGWEDAHEDSSV
jgi:hypothetical protein